jgi:hypothetical protein
MISLYFASSDVAAAQRRLSAKGPKVNEFKHDLIGADSGVKWLNLGGPGPPSTGVSHRIDSCGRDQERR